MKYYLREHLRVLLATLGTLARTPFASLMTIAVIGITLALPASLYVTLRALQGLSHGWDRGGEISAFLKMEIDTRGAQQLLTKVKRWPQVDAVEYLSPSAALAEFRRLSELDAALSLLEENPLPGVLLIRPRDPSAQPLQALLAQVRAQPEVEAAHLDLQWVQRLQALLHIGTRAVIILAALLALAVTLIIGNTIRLAVLNRRAEIEVMSLVGATAAFVRRPFLYAGMVQGALGGALGVVLVLGGSLLLAQPVSALMALYGSALHLQVLTPVDGLYLIALGAGLGYIAARLAVQKHLSF